MQKQFTLLLLLLLLSCFKSNTFAFNEKIVSYRDNNIVFNVSITDSIYEFGDTLTIRYECINNSKKTIYIFNPKQYYWNPLGYVNWDSSYCEYVFKLGGFWNYKVGYESNIMLLAIEPFSKYNYEFRFVLSKKRDMKECRYGLNPWKDPENGITNFAVFNIGYSVENDSIDLSKKNMQGYVEFNKDEDGLFFEAHLTRITLGPLWFIIRK